MREHHANSPITVQVLERAFDSTSAVGPWSWSGGTLSLRRQPCLECQRTPPVLR
jgi:hypothetical protein